MNASSSAGYLQILLLVAMLIPVLFFVLTQYRTLGAIRPENRRMPAGQVWLQCIPFFGLVWQFVTITRISDSIRSELNAPIGDSIFAEEPVPSDVRPTYAVGLSYAICFCVSVIPFPLLKGLAGLAGLVLWIVYWVQLAQYKKKINKRALLLSAPL
jgi:hypothetical protein